MRRIIALATAIALTAVCTLALGDVRLLAVIGDNMVLQQQTDAPIWGWAEPNEQVAVSGSWDSSVVKTAAGADGKWSLNLRTSKAGGPYTVSIKGRNEIVLKNVLIGEVWVCSGQSNMQFMLGKGERWHTGDLNAAEEMPLADYPQIRLFTVALKYNDAPQADCNGAWVQCSPETVKTFSAVGYYFGRELHRKLGVPVGLISTAYGGTAAEAWTKRDAFAADNELAEMLATYERDKVAYPQLRKQYDQEQDAWNAAKSKAAADGKDFAAEAPKRPGRVPNQNSPTVLWNAMVNPIVPFGIRGVIWYQGESNVLKPQQYVRLFQVMMASWRTEWKQGEFPFYFVQIAPHKDMTPDIREAQRAVFHRAPNTGMVVTTDVGDCRDIHPRNKRQIGERLANWALAKTYGVNGIVYCGPTYKDMKVEGGKVRLTFDSAQDGLEVKGEKLEGFTVAGADRKFVPADAVIEGQTVVVWSDEVTVPTAVRFGWENCPTASLFNKAGLPASPFRTDEWPWGETTANK